MKTILPERTALVPAVRRPPLSVSIAITLMVLTGCDSRPRVDYSPLKLARVSGHVTLDGQPLVGAKVDFALPDTVPYLASSARTDEEGWYELRYDSNALGVTPGPKVVKIFGQLGGEGEESSAGSVPSEYNSESKLFLTLEPSERRTIDFELTSDGAWTLP